MLVSNFELLVKPQLPKFLLNTPEPSPEIQKLIQLSRTVIQGYCLTLANPNLDPVLVSLVFTSVKPSIDIEGTVIFLDVDGKEAPEKLTAEKGSNKAGYSFEIPADDTVLFILQPDFVTNPTLLDEANYEVRGYVEIFISKLSKRKESVSLLVTPEHRGTFFKDLGPDVADSQLDQIVYSLPTATGSSLFQLS